MLTSKHLGSDLCLWQKVSHRQKIISGACLQHIQNGVFVLGMYLLNTNICPHSLIDTFYKLFSCKCVLNIQVFCAFLLFGLGFIFPSSPNVPNISITDHYIFSWYNLKQPSQLFCNVTSFKQLTVTDSCRYFSTLTKHNLFTSCTQPGIIWLERLCINFYFFITLADIQVSLCNVLIWNQVWPNSEYIFREGVSKAAQEGNLISFVSLVG